MLKTIKTYDEFLNFIKTKENLKIIENTNNNYNGLFFNNNCLVELKEIEHKTKNLDAIFYSSNGNRIKVRRVTYNEFLNDLETHIIKFAKEY